MAIIKKGTYRFDDVLSLYVQTSFVLPFYVNGKLNEDGTFDPNGITSFYGIDIVNNGTISYCTNIDLNAMKIVYTETEGSEWFWDTFYELALLDGINDERLKGWGQVITVTEDTEVDDDIASVFEAKTEVIEEKPTVDSLKAKLQALINKANEATGRGDVNLDNAVSNLVAGYGTGGGGDIIEVTELPTENINEDALYKMGDSYYQYGELVFDDVATTQEGSYYSYKEAMSQIGVVYSFNTIPTKTTENIKITVEGDTLSETAFHLYYIKDENDIFAYGDIDNTGVIDWQSFGENSGATFNGIISDASEITEQGNYYYAVMVKQWKKYVNGDVIIKVNELPTENIDENTFYKYNEGLYQYKCEFTDIIVLDGDGVPVSLVAVLTAYGFGTFQLYYEKTRPTENIVVSGNTDNGSLFACYYIEDEDDILMYGDFEETGTNTWGSFATLMNNATNGGMISDKSQATDASALYALGEKGWKSYIVPVGNIIITENSTVDVKDKESATVKIPTAYSYQTIAELPADALNGSIAIVFGGE